MKTFRVSSIREQLVAAEAESKDMAERAANELRKTSRLEREKEVGAHC